MSMDAKRKVIQVYSVYNDGIIPVLIILIILFCLQFLNLNEYRCKENGNSQIHSDNLMVALDIFSLFCFFYHCYVAAISQLKQKDFETRSAGFESH